MNLLSNFSEKLVALVRKRKRWLNFILGAADIMALMLTFQISFMIFSEGTFLFLFTTQYLVLFLVMVPAWILMLQASNVAQIPRTGRKNQMFVEFMQFSFMNLVVLFLFYYCFGLNAVSNLFIVHVALLGLVLLFTLRVIEYRIFKWYRKHGHNYLNVVLIADDAAESFIDEMLSRKDWGYNILFIFSDSKFLKTKFGHKAKFLPEKALRSLNFLLEFEIVDEVIYYKYTVDSIDIRQKIRSCEEIGIMFRLRSEIAPIFFTNAHVSKIGVTEFLTFVNIPTNSFWLAFKTAMDTYVSFILIFILSPIFISIALIVKLTSPGPIIFKQTRVGLRGRQFFIYKFRTMVVNAERLRDELQKANEMDGPVFKIKKDPRITSIGNILRKTGLDELPQLFNVLNGDMSLIGPRPPLQSETRQYKRWQLRRLSVKPGITCSWQISPDRNNIKFENWMKLDLAYIDNWSPKLDLILLFKTIRTVIFKTGS
jgi:exopolysaccharide biosynthesis polyprenyl glycosylphosphotransferase